MEAVHHLAAAYHCLNSLALKMKIPSYLVHLLHHPIQLHSILLYQRLYFHILLSILLYHMMQLILQILLCWKWPLLAFYDVVVVERDWHHFPLLVLPI